MRIDVLNQKHPTYDVETWSKYDALYRGGPAFRAVIDQFLPKNPEEPIEVYRCRKDEAFYRSYVGPIVDFFGAKLFSSSLVQRPRRTSQAGAVAPPSGDKAPPDVDPFYADWKENVTATGRDLTDFARERFTSALVKGRSWWIVEKPDDGGDEPQTKQEWEERGLGRPILCACDNDQVYDFEVDEHDRLLWAIVHWIEMRRRSPADSRGTVRETWRVYDRENVETFVAEYDPKGKCPEEAKSEGGAKAHGFSRVPLVRMGFVGSKGVRTKICGKTVAVSGEQLEGLWLVARIADAQVEHFRLSQGLSWNIKRTCYAMPVFKVEDALKPPTMGAGYYIMIGVKEDYAWASPPVEHLSLMAQEVASQKDEIYRIANQMAQGVDNNAAAVGRSGQSKQVDQAATEVCLGVYGAVVREPIEETYELLTELRGESDKLTWSIEGLDTFNLADAQATVDTAVQAAALSVPSPTFRRETFLRVVDAMLPNISQDTKDAIRKEIADGIESEGDLRSALGEAQGIGADHELALAGLGGAKQLGGFKGIAEGLAGPKPPAPPPVAPGVPGAPPAPPAPPAPLAKAPAPPPPARGRAA